MIQLVKSLDRKRYTPRIYMVANTDLLSKEKAVEYEQVVLLYDKPKEKHQNSWTNA
jgi:hypothetical protein